MKPKHYSRLSLEDREAISRGLAASLSFADIARRIGRPTSTMSRKVKNNYSRYAHRCCSADGTSVLSPCGPKPSPPCETRHRTASCRSAFEPRAVSLKLRRTPLDKVPTVFGEYLGVCLFNHPDTCATVIGRPSLLLLFLLQLDRSRPNCSKNSSSKVLV